MNTNATVILGRIAKDIELRTGQSGKSFAKTSIAWNDSKKNADGEWEDGPGQFLNLTAFGHTANSMHAHLNKGDLVLVAGRISYSSWETKDGDKRSSVELLVDSYGLVPKSEKGAGKSKRKTSEPEEDDL